MNFTKRKLNLKHPSASYYELNFHAADGSKIIVDMAIPFGKLNGVIVDFPEYKVPPKDYLGLSRYSLLGYAIFSMHIRAQVGLSENKIPCSHFPFLDNYEERSYYNFVYDDALKLLEIIKKLYPKLPIILTGVGQGAAISIVVAAKLNEQATLFIADCSLCDLENIYIENHEEVFYSNIRNFILDYPNSEKLLLKKLHEIDVLNYAKKVTSKVYYCHSLYETPYPHFAQEKLIASLKSVEVIDFRLEYKKIFQHSFDDFILEKLSKLI